MGSAFSREMFMEILLSRGFLTEVSAYEHDIFSYLLFLCIGSFQVAFQSPSVVYVKENGPAEPLYCVASNHSLEHIYLWENLAATISTSTPVMWPRSRPDTYKCTIRETEDGSECYSGEICVKLGEVHSCISFWAHSLHLYV